MRRVTIRNCTKYVETIMETQEYSTCDILGEDLITELIISNANNALICGTATGCVRVYPWPLGKHADPANYQELRLHNGQVNNLTITNDDYYVLSCGDDGVIFASKISDIQGIQCQMMVL